MANGVHQCISDTVSMDYLWGTAGGFGLAAAHVSVRVSICALYSIYVYVTPEELLGVPD